jgi:hypothetical protein
MIEHRCTVHNVTLACNEHGKLLERRYVLEPTQRSSIGFSQHLNCILSSEKLDLAQEYKGEEIGSCVIDTIHPREQLAAKERDYGPSSVARDPHRTERLRRRAERIMHKGERP